MAGDDEQVAAVAKKYLQRRGSRQALVARPTREELEAVERAMEMRRHSTKEGLIDELEWIVSYARRELFKPRWW